MGTTIKDIASAAGVSPATVSRVLNNNGIVKKDTRERINLALRKSNYIHMEKPRKKKPEFATSSVLQCSYNFAMIWSGGLEAVMGITAQAIMQGLSEAASDVGAVINLEYIPKSDKISDILDRRKIDGLFLSGGRFSDAFVDKAKQFPVVWLLQSGIHGFGDRVQPDHSLVGLQAYRYLRGSGRSRFCCISSRQYNHFFRYWKTREQAFRNAVELEQAECDVIYMDYDDFSTEPVEVQKKAALEVVRQIKGLKNRPDGFFVANGCGLPVYQELMASGMAPFKDFHMVVGDRENCGGYCNPEPVKIDIDARGIGQAAVDAMIWRIRHPERRRVTYMVEPELIVPGNIQ